MTGIQLVRREHRSRRAPFRVLLGLALIVSAIAALPGCGPADTSPIATFDVAHDREQSDGSVLRVSGLDGADEEVYLSLEQLNALPQTSFTSVDPWFSTP
ncbi:MAG: hypothetical protein ACOC0O_03270 [Spirochaetota bacterium]